MPTLDESFLEVVATLAGRYGRPASVAEGLDLFEALVAVALARSVPPKKMAAALDGLREAGLVESRTLAEADPADLSEALRAAKVSLPARSLGPLRRLARWLVERHKGSAEALRDEDVATDRLREELLALNGVGPATADALLLFALRRPVYPVDRASYRILVRHDWLDPTATYDEARAVIERPAAGDPDLLAQLSVWLERVGRDCCRAGVARCERCPLQP
ncbi:MAG: endonuclease III, partial [Singulisphaera sp.]|nr:endonuclease III [Singulisphaera sp.]